MKLAKIFLAIGVAVLYAVFFCYGVYALYEPPVYESDTCYLKFNCEAAVNACYGNQEMMKAGQPVPVAAPVPATVLSQQEIDKCVLDKQSDSAFKTCNEQRTVCQQDFQKSSGRYTHARNSFFILMFIALASLIGGLVFLNKLEAIGPGIWGGGIIIALYALPYTSEYWLTWNKYVKLASIGVILAVLIYFGYKKIEKKIMERGKR
jgi:hypothetical protein